MTHPLRFNSASQFDKNLLYYSTKYLKQLKLNPSLLIKLNTAWNGCLYHVATMNGWLSAVHFGGRLSMMALLGGAMESWQPVIVPSSDRQLELTSLCLIQLLKCTVRTWKKNLEKHIISDVFDQDKLEEGYKRSGWVSGSSAQSCHILGNHSERSKRHSTSTSFNESLCAYLSRCTACYVAYYKKTSFPWLRGERGRLLTVLNERRLHNRCS